MLLLLPLTLLQVRCLYVWNKVDTVTMEDVDRLAREPHSIVISCNMEASWGVGYLFTLPLKTASVRWVQHDR